MSLQVCLYKYDMNINDTFPSISVKYLLTPYFVN